MEGLQKFLILVFIVNIIIKMIKFKDKSFDFSNF